jgi:predicted HD superfamily hydrolase involved in NAD metabolism
MPVGDIARAAEFIEAIRERLPAKKVDHVISVTEMLLGLSEALGIGEEQAAAAGLLHDYCRALPNSDLLRRAEDLGLEITPLQQERPKLLHGPVAAMEIREDFGIDDEEICEAIFWHTTGTPGLGRLGQALYVADFAEPMRKYAEAKIARKRLSKQGFDRALVYVATAKLEIHDRKGLADPESLAFAAWVRESFA